MRLDVKRQLVYRLSDRFCRLVFSQERGVEPILVSDGGPPDFPRRVFLARYVIGEGGGGESGRPIIRNELTGYDYEAQLLYPTQTAGLDGLQSVMESFMYGVSNRILMRAPVKNISTEEQRFVRFLVSDELVSRLADLYDFAW